MSKFVEAIKIYREYGYEITNGLNPEHFSAIKPLYLPFIYIFKKNTLNEIRTGGGISPVEVYMFESISEVYSPQNIFIIGNAFGWSTIIISLCFPNSKIIALDAGIEGKDNLFGINLTNKIAMEKKLNCFVELGGSPEDTKRVVEKYFGNKKLDFVFIDGLHTNKQLEKDFTGIFNFCSENTVFLYHDIINWKLFKAFNTIKSLLINHETHLLYRTTSGMGVSYPKDSTKELKEVFNAFSEKKEYIDSLKKSLTIKTILCEILKRFIPPKFRYWSTRNRCKLRERQ